MPVILPPFFYFVENHAVDIQPDLFERCIPYFLLLLQVPLSLNCFLTQNCHSVQLMF